MKSLDEKIFYIVGFVTIIFTLFVIDELIQYILPIFYKAYFSYLGIYSIFNLAGEWIYLSVIIISLLIISESIKVHIFIKCILIIDVMLWLWIFFLTYCN